MKNKKYILFAGTVVIGALCCMGFVSANQEADFVLVRTMESHPMMNMAKTMIISRSNGYSERFQLKSIDVGASSAEDNLNVEAAKIKEIMDSGYELKDFSGGGGGDGVVYTYLFVKK
jgi:hypothetical protein